MQLPDDGDGDAWEHDVEESAVAGQRDGGNSKDFAGPAFGGKVERPQRTWGRALRECDYGFDDVQDRHACGCEIEKTSAKLVTGSEAQDQESHRDLAKGDSHDTECL